MRSSASVALLAVCLLSVQGTAAAPHDADVKPILRDLAVELRIAGRPAWPKPAEQRVEVTLQPQVDPPAKEVVSFALPFGPDVLKDDSQIRLVGPGGQEIPVFTKPLVHWWLDGRKGSLRSVLIQFEMAFKGKGPRRVVVQWDKARTRSRTAMTEVSKTQARQSLEGYVFHCPRVLALVPAEWLCGSLVAWQQVPAGANKAAAWFDRHLVEKFPASLRNIATRSVEAHLFDRPATYAKVYIRHGEAKYLLAALKAGDFYIQHLGPDGFFRLKKGDQKYVYSEGPAILYMLTGDDRYRDAAMLAIKSWDKWRRIEYTGRGFWTERHAGLGMAAYLHAYELSGQEMLLKKARRYFDAVFALQVRPLDGKKPDGAWLHTGASHGDGNGWTTSPWMSALLADSIWKLWMLTGDKRCPASLAMYAKFTAEHAVTPDGRGVYYMANSPGRGKSINPECPPHNMEACYMLAMGYYLSGGRDKDLLKKIESLWPPIMKDGANRPGRKFNWRFRETSMLIWFLQNVEPDP